MPDEEPQVKNQVSQVPCGERALLLRENDFIHANPARAVAHPIRHNDHIIRQKKVGLVRLQKQFGPGTIDSPLVMRLHDAVITVRHVVSVFATVVHNQRIQALHALQIVVQRLHQVEEPVLLLPERLVALMHVEARHVLLLRPVVLSQRDLVPANGIRVPAAVAVAVGTIKRVALVQIVALGQRLRVRRFQQQSVLQILIGVPVARPAAPRHHEIVAVQNADPQVLVGRRLQAVDVFVHHRAELEPLAIINQQGSRVACAARVGCAELEVVLVVRDDGGQRDGAVNVVVRVKHEQQVGFAARPIQCQGAVVREIDPLVAIQFAGNVYMGLREEILDNLAGCVGGPRVANDPVIKPELGTQHFQSAPNDVRLVLHDHVQAHG